MKKILTVLAIAFLFLGTFSIQSCKKCTNCSYTYQTQGGTDILTYTYPEVCGNNNDVNDIKDVCANAAAAYGNTCTCIDN